MKEKQIHWEHGSFSGKCDRENCQNNVKHRAFDDYSADAIALKSFCDEHYKKGTQKKWLKRKLKSNPHQP